MLCWQNFKRRTSDEVGNVSFAVLLLNMATMQYNAMQQRRANLEQCQLLLINIDVTCNPAGRLTS